jgi:hypothetical protein
MKNHRMRQLICLVAVIVLLMVTCPGCASVDVETSLGGMQGKGGFSFVQTTVFVAINMTGHPINIYQGETPACLNLPSLGRCTIKVRQLRMKRGSYRLVFDATGINSQGRIGYFSYSRNLSSSNLSNYYRDGGYSIPIRLRYERDAAFDVEP